MALVRILILTILVTCSVCMGMKKYNKSEVCKYKKVKCVVTNTDSITDTSHWLSMEVSVSIRIKCTKECKIV